MIRHHFRTALRALRRDRSYALLNGVGLAVAFTCCILIGLFVRSIYRQIRYGHTDHEAAPSRTLEPSLAEVSG